MYICLKCHCVEHISWGHYSSSLVSCKCSKIIDVNWNHYYISHQHLLYHNIVAFHGTRLLIMRPAECKFLSILDHIYVWYISKYISKYPLQMFRNCSISSISNVNYFSTSVSAFIHIYMVNETFESNINIINIDMGFPSYEILRWISIHFMKRNVYSGVLLRGE